MYKPGAKSSNNTHLSIKHQSYIRQDKFSVQIGSYGGESPKEQYPPAPLYNRNKSAGSTRPKPDMDSDLEKALLNLNEYKNNFYDEKATYQKQMEETRLKTKTDGFGMRHTTNGWN